VSGAAARRKGYGYERTIANILKDIFPEAKRHLEFQGQEAKGYDLDNTGEFRIQCKRYKQYAPITKIEEVQETGTPVLITKGDRKKDVVCMYLEDWIKLLKAYNEKEKDS
jgi:hypothetical protein